MLIHKLFSYLNIFTKFEDEIVSYWLIDRWTILLFEEKIWLICNRLHLGKHT